MNENTSSLNKNKKAVIYKFGLFLILTIVGALILAACIFVYAFTSSMPGVPFIPVSIAATTTFILQISYTVMAFLYIHNVKYTMDLVYYLHLFMSMVPGLNLYPAYRYMSSTY